MVIFCQEYIYFFHYFFNTSFFIHKMNKKEDILQGADLPLLMLPPCFWIFHLSLINTGIRTSDQTASCGCVGCTRGVMLSLFTSGLPLSLLRLLASSWTSVWIYIQQSQQDARSRAESCRTVEIHQSVGRSESQFSQNRKLMATQGPDLICKTYTYILMYCMISVSFSNSGEIPVRESPDRTCDMRLTGNWCYKLENNYKL